jgi:site-specific recombinase XerD
MPSGPHGFRLRGLIAVLWRAGLRIHEALALSADSCGCCRAAKLGSSRCA